MTAIVQPMLFPLGQQLMTRGVANRLVEDEAFARFVAESMRRHASGDWGDLGEEDKQENAFALANGFRLLSAYEREGMPKVWIVTERDRSATTVLFPEEY